MAHKDELIASIEKSIAALTTDEASEALEEAVIATARLRTLEEFTRHLQFQAGCRWRQAHTQGGTSMRLCRQSGQPARHPS